MTSSSCWQAVSARDSRGKFIDSDSSNDLSSSLSPELVTIHCLEACKAMDHFFFYILKGKSFLFHRFFPKLSLLAKSDRLKYIHRRPPLFWAKWAKLNRYECVISTQLGQDDLQKRSLLADSVKHSVGKSSENRQGSFW